jgi:DNA-binding CsgD family transcriptional regulator
MDELDFLSKIFLCLTQSESIEDRLRAALLTIKEFVDVDMASIIFIPETKHDFRVISVGAGSDELIEEYKKEYFYVDNHHGFPDSKAVVFHPAEGLVEGDAATQPFRDFCREKLHIRSAIGIDFQLHDSLQVRLRLTRLPEQGEFTAVEIEALDKVAPYIKRAIDQAVYAQYHSLFDFSAQKILARFRIGIMVINKSLEVMDKTPLVDKLLASSDAFTCNNKKLIARSKDYQSRIERMMRELSTDEKVVYRTMSVAVPRSRDEYTLAITRNVSSLQDSLFLEERFTVFIFSSAEENVDMGILVALWRISPAEQRVLSAIMRFDNVKKVANELNISPNTAKAQLKSVYRKLGIDSKTMLIKRLNSAKNMAALLG